jgi:hypothetical protein
MKDAMSIDPAHFKNLRQKLISGEITAITFDTQAFDRNSRTFRGGLIGQLSQLKNSNIKLIVTELVRDEAERHMLEMHQSRYKRVDDALALVSHHLSDDLVDYVREELDARPDPQHVVFNEINDFFLKTDAEIIYYEEVSTRKLFELYFTGKPPFHKSNEKKHEFPDAVALLSLEAYAENNGILVVSEDKDWVTFCSQSESKRLHCVPDLTTALALINSVEVDVKEIVSQRFLRFQQFNENGELQSAVRYNVLKGLKDALLFSARTSYFYNSRCSSIEIISIRHGEDKTFGTIRDDSSQTVWVIELDVECRIMVDVSFSAADETYIGSSHYEHLILVPTISIVKITSENIGIETTFDPKTTLDLGFIAPNELSEAEEC